MTTPNYHLYIRNEHIASFRSSLSARLYAQGLPKSPLTDYRDFRIWSEPDNGWILIAHLIEG